MKTLVGTDLLLYHLLKTDFVDGINLAFRWIRLLNDVKCIDVSSIAILTHFMPTAILKNLQDFVLIEHIPPKSRAIKELEALLPQFPEKDRKGALSLLAQLNCVDNGVVDFMITENPLTLDFAKFLHLDDRVYTIEDFIEKCTAEHRDLDTLKGMIVKKVKFGELSIGDPFFDTFKEEYQPYYLDWFRKKADNDVFVSQNQENHVLALLKLKTEDEKENYDDIFPRFKPAKRLKISSFKVEYTGHKLGERFMRIIFDQALAAKVNEIYVTIFDTSKPRRRLMDMISRWGFEKKGVKNGKELVYVRDFSKCLQGDLCKDFPFHKFENTVFIIPIYKNYADELLPSTNERMNIADIEPYKNAIRKVLVLHADNMNLQRGSILLFYQKTREEEKRGIIAVGVVEDVFRGLDTEKKFILRCRKRSILDDTHLKDCWKINKEKTVVVNFLYNYYFNKGSISRTTIERAGIDTKQLESQRAFQISREQFDTIIEGTEYEKDIIVH